MRMPPVSSEWETTCILSGGVSGRVASSSNIEKQKAEKQGATGYNDGEGREGHAKIIWKNLTC